MFHFVLIPLGKTWSHLVSFQLWVDSRTDGFFSIGKVNNVGEWKFWIQSYSNSSSSSSFTTGPCVTSWKRWGSWINTYKTYSHHYWPCICPSDEQEHVCRVHKMINPKIKPSIFFSWKLQKDKKQNNTFGLSKFSATKRFDHIATAIGYAF